MKKVIRLTESDLTRIVRRVIKEQSNKPNDMIELMKKVYLRYKPLGRDGIYKNKKRDADVLKLQKYFNSTGQLGKDKKYNELVEDGIFGENTWWEVNNTLGAYDRKWWSQNQY
jgi:hypothetical protein